MVVTNKPEIVLAYYQNLFFTYSFTPDSGNYPVSCPPYGDSVTQSAFILWLATSMYGL